MLVGMGTVFVFLTGLVLVTSLMSRLVVRFIPEPVAVASAVASRSGGAAADDEIIAVIAAAIRAHRSRSSSKHR